jgi:tetratricopeptide (TPR) repeat protein
VPADLAAASGPSEVEGSSVARGRSWLLWAAITVVVGTLIYVGVTEARQAAYAARLPLLPELSDEPPAVRDHLTEADRVARADPTSDGHVGALGLAYHADMFYDQAERCYQLAENLSGFAWRWTYYRALVQGERGDADGLAAGLRGVVAAAPDFGPAWWRLGEAEFKAVRHDRAEEAWRRALALPEPTEARAGSTPRVASAPISAYAALGLARLALLRGEAERARAMLEAVIAKAPGFGPAFRVLGNAYDALGRVADGERAVRIADRLPAYEPYVDPMIEALIRESRSTTFLLRQAATADLTRNAAWREYLARRALEFDPEHPDVLYELGTMYRVLGRYDEALDLLQRHRRLVPDDFQVLADIGRCLAGLQRFVEAESVLRRALEGLDDANTRYALGFVLDQAGRLVAAVAEYQRALDRDPNHLDALNNLGVALVRQGRLDEAARQFERALVINPESADTRTNLGVVFLAQKDHERAAREFRAALHLNPEHARARDGLRAVQR